MDAPIYNFKLIVNHAACNLQRSASTAMTGEGGRHERQPSDDRAAAAPLFAKPDIVRRFLAWAQSADAEARAEGASALARAYLYSDLAASVARRGRAGDDRRCSTILRSCVRRALAEALCSAREAPRALVLALAADEPEVAAPVLQHSPVLTDADLVDCVASGDVVAQTALARRPYLPPAPTPRWSRPEQFDAVLALIANLEIDLPAKSLQRIFTRFSDDASVRDGAARAAGFCQRALRARIVVGGGKGSGASRRRSGCRPREPSASPARRAIRRSVRSLRHAVPTSGWSSRARCAPPARLRRPCCCVRCLAENGLCSRRLWRNCPACRSRASPPLSLSRTGEGFAALARRAGLKGGVLLAFRAALAAIKTQAAEAGDGLKLPLVQKVIDDLRAARRSGARQGSGAAVALRRRSGEGGSRELRPRGGGFGRSRPASARSGIFARQRRSRGRRRS